VATLSEYILLRKENDLLNCLIGQSFNSKNKFEAEKILDEIHSKAQDRLISKKALVYVTKNNLIRHIGGSTLMMNKNGKIVSNLILDNMGEWISGLFNGSPSGLVQKTLKDVNGVNRTVAVRSSTVTVLNGSTDAGGSIRVGSGTLAPSRLDFNVQTGFGTAPEDAFIKTSIPFWNSGLGNFKPLTSMTAGGAGTINESVLSIGGKDTGGTTRSFIWFRDIISPSVSFVVGQSIVIEYTVQM